MRKRPKNRSFAVTSVPVSALHVLSQRVRARVLTLSFVRISRADDPRLAFSFNRLACWHSIWQILLATIFHPFAAPLDLERFDHEDCTIGSALDLPCAAHKAVDEDRCCH